MIGLYSITIYHLLVHPILIYHSLVHSMLIYHFLVRSIVVRDATAAVADRASSYWQLVVTMPSDHRRHGRR